MMDNTSLASLESRKLNLFYGNFHAIKDVTVRIPEKSITSIIGPSGCGKSTLLRIFNRMNDLIPGVRITGQVLMHGHNIYSKHMDTAVLRKRVGMVFQRPNPFPFSIFENVAYGPKIHDLASERELPEIVENSLKKSGLWDELKDRLSDSALSLSPEQRQRLCISRLLATEPEVLLMDEPCSALDPIATAKIEELMLELRQKYTIVIVTHNMQQAARISNFTAFMLLGEMLEFDSTSAIFTNPQHQKTQDYVTGRFG
ncbi:MAG: phosphate ABC transporter ATP-binding protein PstB [Elusimicrobiota bacterium]